MPEQSTNNPYRSPDDNWLMEFCQQVNSDSER